MVPLYRQIRNWAQNNNWYKAHIVSHKLWLSRNFSKDIRKKVVLLETGGSAALAARIERDFAELLKKAGQFDRLCKKGCESEEEFAEFEHIKKQLKSAAFGLAQVLQISESAGKGKDIQWTNIPIVEYKEKIHGPASPMPQKTTAEGRDEFITFKEAALLLGVSKGTVSRWVKETKIKDNGKIGHERRVSKSAVLILKNEREQQDLVKDAAELHRDAAKIRSMH